MKLPLIIIGGGGHARSIVDVAELAGYDILGFIDNTPEANLLGYNCLGNDDNIVEWVGKAQFIVGVGQINSSHIRRRIHEHIKAMGGQLATIVSPLAHISRHATLGEGSVVMHQAVINAGAAVGVGAIINTFANVEHDALVGDFVHISTGAMVNGACAIGDDCFIGSGVILQQGVAIHNNVVIAAGSVVRKSLKVSGVYAGNPALLMIKR